MRHKDAERHFGFTGESTAGFTEARETAYKNLFGEILRVSHEILQQIPHIDVYTFRRRQDDQPVYSLVTGGMSDLPMMMPRGAEEAPRRVELFLGPLRKDQLPHVYDPNRKSYV